MFSFKNIVPKKSNKLLHQNDVLYFPHTIGDITFYTSKELTNWVLLQQEICKKQIKTVLKEKKKE